MVKYSSFFLFPLLFSCALKLGQAGPSHGDSFQTELPKRLLCHECSQYRCHARKLIEKRLTRFKACWELGARRKPRVLKPRYSPACYKKATYGHGSGGAPACTRRARRMFPPQLVPLLLHLFSSNGLMGGIGHVPCFAFYTE